MATPERSHYHTIGWLWQAGLRFASVIDVGSADGHFALHMKQAGPFRASTLLNIDAQEDYRETLAAIQSTIGGHFRICAVGERDGGTVELTRGVHAYWTSVRPAEDPYWDTLNNLQDKTKMKVKVPLRTLDSLVQETALPGPYLIKMDIQGAEVAALAGASKTLADTDAVAIEMMVEDFAAIHESLTQAGFDVFDITDPTYTHAGVLGWFYAVYLNSRNASLRPPQYWDARMNDQVIAAQHQRREGIRTAVADLLRTYRAGEWPDVQP
jgi:FkbM family methyltransferase